MTNEEKEALKEAGAQVEEEQTFKMTKGELKLMVQEVRDEVIAALTPEPKGRLTNADLVREAAGPGVQSQEEVESLAATVGPVSHRRGFVPAVPEFVATLDMAEHRPLIGRLEAFGYVVMLDRVEFTARWEPTEVREVDCGNIKRANVIVERPEPEEAKPLLAQLRNADPRHSRVWLTNKLAGRTISGEQSLMEAVAADAMGAEMQPTTAGKHRESVIASLEGGALPGSSGIELSSADAMAGVETT